MIVINVYVEVNGNISMCVPKAAPVNTIKDCLLERGGEE